MSNTSAEVDQALQLSLSGLIDSEYKELQDCKLISQKVSYLNNIIQLKSQLNKNGKDDIFIDIKQFIKYYILSTDERAFGYDEVVFAKIEEKMLVTELPAKLALYKYTSKILKSNGYEEQYKECESKMLVLKKQFFLANPSIPNGINWFYILTTESKTAIAISLAASITISTVFLLPAFIPKLACIDFTTASYSDHFFLNRIMNTLSVMMGLDDSVKVRPINTMGFLVTIFGKSLFLLIIANILVKQLLSKFNPD